MRRLRAARGRDGVRLLLAATALFAACNDDLPKANKIERFRLLGVHLAVGDPSSEQATPGPGDSLDLSVLYALPRDQQDDEIRVSWVACASNPFVVGTAGCDPSTLQLIGIDGPPEASTTVPELVAGHPPESLLVFGVACDGGHVTLPSGGLMPSLQTGTITFPRCEGGTDQDLFQEAVPVLGERSSANANPPPFVLELDDAAWSPDEMPDVDNHETSSRAHHIRVSAADASFETYVFHPYDSTITEQRREELLVAFYSDEGELDGQYVAVTSEAPMQTIDWSTPRSSDLPDDRTVRFWMVARDDRGGVRMEQRSLRVR